jgi:hypothetical protein
MPFHHPSFLDKKRWTGTPSLSYPCQPVSTSATDPSRSHSSKVALSTSSERRRTPRLERRRGRLLGRPCPTSKTRTKVPIDSVPSTRMSSPSSQERRQTSSRATLERLLRPCHLHLHRHTTDLRGRPFKTKRHLVCKSPTSAKVLLLASNPRALEVRAQLLRPRVSKCSDAPWIRADDTLNVLSI